MLKCSNISASVNYHEEMTFDTRGRQTGGGGGGTGNDNSNVGTANTNSNLNSNSGTTLGNTPGGGSAGGVNNGSVEQPTPSTVNPDATSQGGETTANNAIVDNM